MELRDRNFILIDTETTGFDEKKHQILEVGILVIKDLKVIDEFEVKIKHREYTITAKAMEVNNINIVEHEKEALFEKEATERMLEFLNKHKCENDEGTSDGGRPPGNPVGGICDRGSYFRPHSRNDPGLYLLSGKSPLGEPGL